MSLIRASRVNRYFREDALNEYRLKNLFRSKWVPELLTTHLLVLLIHVEKIIDNKRVPTDIVTEYESLTGQFRVLILTHWL